MVRSCKDCTKRVLGCHSTCEEYISEKAHIDLEKSVIKKIQGNYANFNNNSNNFTKY